MGLPDQVRDLLRNPETPNGVLADCLRDWGLNVASVFVVLGDNRQDFEDYEDWLVRAFLIHEEATAFAAECLAYSEAVFARCKELLNAECTSSSRQEENDVYEERKRFTEEKVRYFVVEIPLVAL